MNGERGITIDVNTAGGGLRVDGTAWPPSSVLGRLIRLIAFPFLWVLFGRAKL
jgi:hypothetical protein